jgi:cardiolipin synthase (CMP-forming)
VIRELGNVPNIVSLIRLALIPVFIWLVVIAEYGWAGILLGVIGATDWVDGFLARRLDQVTEIGKFLDPLADRIAVIVAVIAGLISGVLPAWFAIALVLREALIGLGALYGWTHGVTKLDVRWLGKAATLGLYVAISLFYVGEGFDLDVVTFVAYGFGIPSLIMYYWVGVEYVGDMRTAIRAAK